MKHMSCEGCACDLGGLYGNCREGLEDECKDGGFEAWRPKAMSRDDIIKALSESAPNGIRLNDMIVHFGVIGLIELTDEQVQEYWATSPERAV